MIFFLDGENKSLARFIIAPCTTNVQNLEILLRKSNLENIL